jgi:hypothetical protein
MGVAPGFMRWSLASQLNVWPAVISTVPFAESPNRYFPCVRAASWRMLLPGLCIFLAARNIIQQPDDHWQPLYSNLDAVLKYACFQSLAFRAGPNLSEFW